MLRNVIGLGHALLALLLLRPATVHAAVFDSDGGHVPDTDADSGVVDWVALTPEDGLSGVGVLSSPGFGDVCTATLIDTGAADGPAYVLSNAHCNFFEHLGTDSLEPTEHRVDQDTSYYVSFNHYVGVPAGSRFTYALRLLSYVTEHDTDVAIYEVDATLAELRGRGIEPIAIADREPALGDRVTLVGVPLLYVPESMQSLHRSSCLVGETVELRNGSYSAPRSVVHRCSSLPGFSGGPLLSEEGQIVLLNSHGTDESWPVRDCTYESRPCEVLSDGSTIVLPERNYAQYVASIAGCFDGAGHFDLARSDCGLPVGTVDSSNVGCAATGRNGSHPWVFVVVVATILALRNRGRIDAGGRRVYRRAMLVSMPRFAMTLVFALCGCGNSETDTRAPEPAVQPAPVENATPAPAPEPSIPPEQAAARKTSEIAGPCVNHFSGAVRRIRQQYLTRADREDGPTRLDAIAAGIFYLPSDQIPACRQAIDRAVAMQPPLPEFDAAAPVYATALEAVAPPLTEASDYYGRQSYQDDDGDGARRIHATLLSRLDAFVNADDALSRVSQAIEQRALDVRVSQLERDPNQRGRFLIERARSCAMRTLHRITALEIAPAANEFHFVDPYDAPLFPAVEECQRFVDEMRNARQAAEVDTGGSYRNDANSYVGAAIIVARAVRDGTTYSSELEAANLIDACVGAYNSMIDDYNRL